MTFVPPNGCRWCGELKRNHGIRSHKNRGRWEEPGDELRYSRMLANKAEAPAWTGPTCVMCMGTGETTWHPADGSTQMVRCPACAGHGRDAV